MLFGILGHGSVLGGCGLVVVLFARHPQTRIDATLEVVRKHLEKREMIAKGDDEFLSRTLKRYACYHLVRKFLVSSNLWHFINLSLSLSGHSLEECVCVVNKS